MQASQGRELRTAVQDGETYTRHDQHRERRHEGHVRDPLTGIEVTPVRGEPSRESGHGPTAEPAQVRPIDPYRLTYEGAGGMNSKREAGGRHSDERPPDLAVEVDVRNIKEPGEHARPSLLASAQPPAGGEEHKGHEVDGHV